MVVKSVEKSKPSQKRLSGNGVQKVQKKRYLWVIKLQCLPFGFFEKELLGYFQQFGTVIRVRVARNRSTGNHKGWAYVGFDNKDVAEIAAETMNGYLMFEHRLIVKVMKPTEIPKSMLKGPVTLPRPSFKGLAKKDALARNHATNKNDEQSLKRRQTSFQKSLKKLANLGIQYELAPSGSAELKKKVAEADEEIQVVIPPPAKTPKNVTIAAEPKKTPQAKKVVEQAKTPAFSPKTRAAKAAASAVSTPARTSAISKAIAKSVAASARPAVLEKKTITGKKGKKKSL